MMHVVVAGAHGQIARQLHPLLTDQGHKVQGLIRNPDQAPTVERAGAVPVMCDLEAEAQLDDFLEEADAVVFAAGAGPGSGEERKWRLDRDGAVKLIDAACRRGVERFVMVSVMNPDQPRGSEVFQAYLEAKRQAEDALRASGLDWTIVRPGRLTDDPATGRVSIARDLERDDVPRGDVATTVAETLAIPETAHWTFDVVGGNQPVHDALKGLLEDA